MVSDKVQRQVSRRRTMVATLAMLAALDGAASTRARAAADGAESGDAQDIATVTVDATRAAPGGGLLADQTVPKTVSAVTADYIGQQAPTLNAFQLVALLPGANVASSDPYGLSTASSLTLRGLGQDEIGVLMEGAPQNDIGNYFAYPSQFADTENLSMVSLAQGSVDLDSPILNGAGGLLSVSLRDPAREAGGLLDFSFGSYGERREFLRLDSGLIGDSGLRAFISYSRTDANNWRGAGEDKKQHVDFKVVEEWGDGNRVALAASFNDAISSGYPLPTLDQWHQYGRSYNYDSGYTAGDQNYWKLYASPFRNLYFSAPSHFTLGDDVTLDVTPYVQTGYGNSPYGTGLTTTGNTFGNQTISQPLVLPGAQDGAATLLGNYTGDQFRSGGVAKLTYAVGDHTLVAGVWYDYADDKDVESFTPIDGQGNPVDIWGYADHAIKLPDGRLFTALDDHTITQVKAFFVADTLSLLDKRLTVDFGFKGVYVSRDGTNGLPGPQYRVSFDDFQALPRGSVRYQIDERSQMFANVTTNFRSPDEYTLYDTYEGGSLSGSGTTRLKDEYSVAEEVGYRYSGDLLSGSISFFNYNFSNRQITTTLNVDGALINSSVNAGGQTSRGVDAEIGLRPIRGFSPYVSAEYLNATIDDDIPVNGDLLPTRGKTAVRSPKVQAAIGVTYDSDGLFGSVAGKYIGAQYATFMNDERIADHGQFDASIGYHLPGWNESKASEVRLNLINITDEKILSGVASPTTNAKAVTGVNGTAIDGAAPTYYIGSGFAAVLTLSSQF